MDSVGYPLEGLMLKLKLQYFGHLMQRANILEKTLMLGGIGCRRRRATQGNRLSCRDQEGRRGSDEVVLGTSGFPSSETGMSGNFWSLMKGAK